MAYKATLLPHAFILNLFIPLLCSITISLRCSSYPSLIHLDMMSPLSTAPSSSYLLFSPFMSWTELISFSLFQIHIDTAMTPLKS